MPAYADVIVPAPLPQAYTYAVPEELADGLAAGQRVVVPLGRQRLLMGIVLRLHDEPPGVSTVRQLVDTIGNEPLATPLQLQFWQWMASYYMCALGEVMLAALPAGLKLEPESVLSLPPDSPPAATEGLSAAQQELLARVAQQGSLRVGEVLRAENASAARLINSLVRRGLLLVEERMSRSVGPRREAHIYLGEATRSTEALGAQLDGLGRAPRQQELLLAFVRLLQEEGLPLSAPIARRALLARVEGADAALRALIGKGVMRQEEREVSSLDDSLLASEEIKPLSPAQLEAYQQIGQAFAQHDVALLHGLTGSGKTEVYMHLIADTLAAGQQVLYILPEIALTTQIINRMQRVFGARVGVYHSRQPDRYRTELYEAVLHGVDRRSGAVYDVIIGARSAIFLPFSRLGLVVVDEEHDPSFKQTSPAPRYNARDAAIVLASLARARVLLGTATPSVETYTNAQRGKYGYIELSERFGPSRPPSVELVDVRLAGQQGLMQGHFSQRMLRAIRETLAEAGQVILFQNRRGFAPYVECPDCGWVAQCPNCDVSLNYHKADRAMHCHYCSYQEEVPKACPACGSVALRWRGLGTQRVEDELLTELPEARVGRLDLDTTRSRHGASRVMEDFSAGRLDVLVGTQMLTKGLDFSNVRLVGILDADGLMRQSDFRAHERAFQLMAQVAGRAGRSDKAGHVLVQTRQPELPLFGWVQHTDYPAFYSHAMAERQESRYPPFVRLVQLRLLHREKARVDEAAGILALSLRGVLGQAVLGPQAPPIAWIAQRHIMQLLVKIEPGQSLQETKRIIHESVQLLRGHERGKSVRVVVNVDP